MAFNANDKLIAVHEEIARIGSRPCTTRSRIKHDKTKHDKTKYDTNQSMSMRSSQGENGAAGLGGAAKTHLQTLFQCPNPSQIHKNFTQHPLLISTFTQSKPAGPGLILGNLRSYSSSDTLCCQYQLWQTGIQPGNTIQQC